MSAMTPWLAFGGLCLWTLVGVIFSAVRLPGVWVILAGAVAYDWYTGWETLPTWLLVALGGSAIVAEVLELATSVVVARRAGASNRAAWGGLLGALLGMFFLSFLLPVPVIGSVFGALAGCFLGALIGELSLQRELSDGARVGMFSVIGFVMGLTIKLGIACAMAGVTVTWSLLAMLGKAPAV